MPFTMRLSDLFFCRVYSISSRDHIGEPTAGNDSNDQINDIPGQIPRHLTPTLPVDARHQHRGELRRAVHPNADLVPLVCSAK